MSSRLLIPAAALLTGPCEVFLKSKSVLTSWIARVNAGFQLSSAPKALLAVQTVASFCSPILTRSHCTRSARICPRRLPVKTPYGLKGPGLRYRIGLRLSNLRSRIRESTPLDLNTSRALTVGKNGRVFFLRLLATQPFWVIISSALCRRGSRLSTGEASIAEKPASMSNPLTVREIEVDDHTAVAAYLGASIGYPQSYFEALFAILRAKVVPPGYPRYGYVARVGQRVIGAILLIFTKVENHGVWSTRCHVTSWCVDKQYRTLAAALFVRGFKFRDVTYINISAGPGVRLIIQAQGFKEYSRGEFVFSPFAHILRRPSIARARILDWRVEPDATCDSYDSQVVRDHGAYGCLSFWCIHEKRAYPFVFHERVYKSMIPGVQLLYCRDIDSLVRLVGPVSRFLARRGKLFVAVDANGPVAGLTGHYLTGTEPRYFKGSAQPRLGDLAYTQKALLPFIKRRPPSEDDDHAN